MTKQWFVLHTLTGQENKVQKSIEARVKLERMEEFIGRCVIPTEKVVEKKNGWSDEPGYWVDYKDDVMLTGWQPINKKWYYFEKNEKNFSLDSY